MLPDKPSSPYCSLAEAAEYLGVNDRTIRRAISAGRLRAYRLNARQIRLRRQDLDGLLTRIPTAS